MTSARPFGAAHQTGRTLCSSCIRLTLTLFAVALATVSCGRGQTLIEMPPRVTLEFSFDDSLGGVAEGDFREDNCYVLRCTELTYNERAVVFSPSKSKKHAAAGLIFVEAPRAELGETTRLACVRILGKEYEYDIETAQVDRVELSILESIVEDYGMTYQDWLAGACSDMEQFPCCVGG